jgi:UDP-N-acetyl-D-galactosamine dehydrogenase
LEYGIDIIENFHLEMYRCIVLAVNHDEFADIDFKSIRSQGETVLFDTKGFIDRDFVDARL